jgi:ATP-binding cassette subfamily B protein
VTDFSALIWPEDRLPSVLWEVARALRVVLPPPTAVPRLANVGSAERTRFIDQYADYLGIKSDPLEPRHRELETLLAVGAPLLLQVPLPAPGWLLVLQVHGSEARLSGPDGVTRTAEVSEVLALVRSAVDARVQDEIVSVIAAAGIVPSKRARAHRALLAERAADEPLSPAWSFTRREPGSWSSELAARGFGRLIAYTLAAHAASYTLALLSWWLIGSAALRGRLDSAWVVAWGLLMFLQVPLIMIEGDAHGRAGIALGTWLRQKLSAGILGLAPDRLRGLGVGAFVGQLMEVQVAETLALGTGFAGAVALLEIVASAIVLAISPGGLGPLLVLGVWLVVGVGLSAQYVARQRTWARSRLAMTHDLVEAMSGHRTRLALESGDHWHDNEDQALASYLEISERADRSMTRLSSLLPRGYLVLALLAMSPAFVNAGHDTSSLAAALGTVLLIYRALRRVVTGLESVASLASAREQLAPILSAGQPSPRPAAPVPQPPLPRTPPSPNVVVLEARDVSFTHRASNRPVLASCSLKVGLGDRLLLEGDSGGGKSTLAALLSGIRDPSAGLILSRGLDCFTLGMEEWHRRVVLAPQFHENHVFSSTFLFNLVLGTGRSPTHDDLLRIREICNELMLDDLLTRMPAGLEQMVGETGWQLSHGEKSRLFIARALVQDPDVVVLDESLAALDPRTLISVLACLRARARSLLLVAHP